MNILLFLVSFCVGGLIGVSIYLFVISCKLNKLCEGLHTVLDRVAKCRFSLDRMDKVVEWVLEQQGMKVELSKETFDWYVKPIVEHIKQDSEKS